MTIFWGACFKLPLVKEPLPNTQPKSPLTQPQAIPWVLSLIPREISACSCNAPHEEAVNHGEVSPQCPLLQAEQTT